jgi:hypothetical protein
VCVSCPAGTYSSNAGKCNSRGDKTPNTQTPSPPPFVPEWLRNHTLISLFHLSSDAISAVEQGMRLTVREHIGGNGGPLQVPASLEQVEYFHVRSMQRKRRPVIGRIISVGRGWLEKERRMSERAQECHSVSTYRGKYPRALLQMCTRLWIPVCTFCVACNQSAIQVGSCPAGLNFITWHSSITQIFEKMPIK